MPYGTKVEKVLCTLTIVSSAGVSDVEVQPYALPDSTFHLAKLTDSVDFSAPVKFVVHAYDGITTKTYLAQVNIHQVNPDTMVWAQASEKMLPVAFSEQKTVLVDQDGEKSYYMYATLASGAGYQLYQAPANAPTQWTEQPLQGLPSDGLQWQQLAQYNKVWYVAASDGSLYQSADGKTWSLVAGAPAIQFLLGSNMSEVISIFAATLMGFTILKPVHLLWINLVTDCFPALALGMEKAEGNIMHRRPRPAKDGIFAGGMGFDIAYQGVLISALVLAAYFVGHYIETGVWTITDSADGTTMAFLTMSMAEICHSFNMRSLRGCIFTMGTKNKALVWAAAGSIAATTLVCEVPFLANAFGFTPVSFVEYVIAMGIGMVGMVIVELVKVFQRKAMRRRGEIL